MEDYNYLNAGMLTVIPFLILFTALFVKKTYNLSLGKSFLFSILGLLMMYIIFYQWLWYPFNRILYTLTNNYNLDFSRSYPISMSCYIITTLLYLFFFTKPFHKLFNRQSLFIYRLFVLINIIILSIKPIMFIFDTLI